VSGAGRFLERWSRLKRRADAPQPAAPPAPLPAPPAPTAEASAVPAAPAHRPDTAPELPPVETLGLDSDFTAFLREEVSESLRRAALKKLFSDPHFNRMDGLDIYIDDYSVADPIPPDVMERLRQAQQLLRSEEPAETADSASQVVPGGPAAPVEAAPPAAPEAPAAAKPGQGDAPPECDSLDAAGQNVPSPDK